MNAEIKTFAMSHYHFQGRESFTKNPPVILVGDISTKLPEVKNFLIIFLLVFVGSFRFCFTLLSLSRLFKESSHCFYDF